MSADASSIEKPKEDIDISLRKDKKVSKITHIMYVLVFFVNHILTSSHGAEISIEYRLRQNLARI